LVDLIAEWGRFGLIRRFGDLGRVSPATVTGADRPMP
jgi:hypothetical protein